MTFNKYFDVVYCICMPNRKEHMKKFFKNFKTKFKFINPILKKDLLKYSVKDLIDQNIITPNYAYNTTIGLKFSYGAYACALSHFKAIETFLKSKKKKCLIFEDDIYITNEKNTIRLNNYLKDVMINQIPKDWGYINFGRCYDRNCNGIKVNRNVIKKSLPLCNHAYALKKDYAKLLIKKKFPLDVPFDHMTKNIYFINKKNNEHSYVITPSIFLQDRLKFESEIETSKDLYINFVSIYPECKTFLGMNNRKYIKYQFADEEYNRKMMSKYNQKWYVNFISYSYLIFIITIFILLIIILIKKYIKRKKKDKDKTKGN